MDAVFNPLSITNPYPFLQEGWHYELDSKESDLTYNGVVYNEMKGVYSDPDTVLDEEMNKLLFPDNCYSFVSGGKPENIPDLTYQNYVESHTRFYHPSNSYIFLDGNVNLEEVLTRLDSFLCKYDRVEINADIPMQQCVSPAEATCRYEVGAGEGLENKTILSQGWVVGNFDEPEKRIACTVLSELLCASNESPLKKALVNHGLAEDVEFRVVDGMQQIYALLVVRNASEKKKDKIRNTVYKVIKKIADKGIDKKQLHAVINHLEFMDREKDFGTMPKGLVYAISSLETWLYGGDPALNLCSEELFKDIREKADNGWFETFMCEALLENPHNAKLCMLPSETVGEENQKKEQARLNNVRSQWNDEQVNSVIMEYEKLTAYQQTADTEEQLQCLPILSLSDIPEKITEIPQEIKSVDGTAVLHNCVETDGIVYLDLHFSLADMEQDTMPLIGFLAQLIGQIETEKYGIINLQSEIDANLGQLSASPMVYAYQGSSEKAVPYLVVNVSLLENKKKDAVRLIDEILNHSLFKNKQYIFFVLRQLQMFLEQNIISSGNKYAAQHASASFSAPVALSDAFVGLGFLRWVQNTVRNFKKDSKALISDLTSLRQRLFSKNRLTVSLTGQYDEKFVSDIINILPLSDVGAEVQFKSVPMENEGIVIPSDVGYAAKASNLSLASKQCSGEAMVAAQLLTYGYLWNTIRVKGGAYGTGMKVHKNGEILVTSYRDPSPSNSLDSFDGTVDALKAFCESDEQLDKYIISTIASADSLLTPRMQGVVASDCYFTGRTMDDRQKLYQEILHTTKEKLSAFCKTLGLIQTDSAMCVIGGKTVIDACKNKLNKITNLQ